MTEAAEALPDFGAELLLDPLPIPGYPPPVADPAPAVQPAQPPAAIPAMPTLPSLGGASLPAPGLPLGSGMSLPPGTLFPGPGGLVDRISPADANLAKPEPDPAAEPDVNPDTNDDAQPFGELGEPTEEPQTTVQLPDGDTVIAASPALAKVVAAAVAGTPIPDAFRAQGITIPAPGSPVTQPVDEVALAPGDVGILADRHALALGNGKVVLDGRIQPIASVTGPGFLGWEHPPGPAAMTPPRTGGPTPTRPAVTAGPAG